MASVVPTSVPGMDEQLRERREELALKRKASSSSDSAAIVTPPAAVDKRINPKQRCTVALVPPPPAITLPVERRAGCQICNAIKTVRGPTALTDDDICSICRGSLLGDSMFDPPDEHEEFSTLYKACVQGQQSPKRLIAHTVCTCQARQHVVCLIRALPSARGTRRVSPGCCICRVDVALWFLCRPQEEDEKGICLDLHGFGGAQTGAINTALCMYCQHIDNELTEQFLLLCDGARIDPQTELSVECPNTAHIYCCRLTRQPRGRWYCVECAKDTPAALMYTL
jgi:hypothetical protein